MNFKIILQGEDIEAYSIVSETKVAFAEKAIQSLKVIIYRYIEDNGRNFFPKMQQFVSNLNCRTNHSVGKSPREVKNKVFLKSILYNNSFMKFTKTKT